MSDLVVLPDVLEPDLSLVVCGTGVGKRSAVRQQYYAGPGNRFWKTLSDTQLTPRLFSPAEYRELLRFGIGLTDLVKHSQVAMWISHFRFQIARRSNSES